MKCINMIILLLIILNNCLFSDCICYYNSEYKNMTKVTCEYYKMVIDKLLNEDCSIEPLYNFSLNRKYDKVVIVDMGHYNGILKPFQGIYPLWDNSSLILYKDLAKVEANLLILDACYAGYIFDYHHKAKVVITSTGKENSWNPEINGKNIGSLAISLNCIYNSDFDCPVNCSKDVNTCQLSLIFSMFYNHNWFYYINSGEFYNWEYPSIGTCLINGKPCKNFSE